MERFPRDSAVLPRTSVFSGRAPMCRGSRSAHGRISTALSAGVFPHDSADLPRAGPGRMCSTAPTSPRTAQWVRRRRPDTPDPATRATAPRVDPGAVGRVQVAATCATAPRGSPEKPPPGARPRPNPRESALAAPIRLPNRHPRRERPGSRNASPAQQNPPQLTRCEPSPTQSTCARIARAHLAQCRPR